MNPHWWCNGEPGHTADPGDRAFAYGDGLFETIAIRHGQPRFWEHHHERLSCGASRLALRIPKEPTLLDWLADVIAVTSTQCGVAKLVLSRGAGPRGYRAPADALATAWISVLPAALPAAHSMRTAWSGCRLARQTALAGVKHLNRLEQVLASSASSADAHDEVLLRDTHDHVICATMANVFIVRDNRLQTPAITHAGVAGVMRRVVLEIAHRNGVEVLVDEFDARSCLTADGIFLTNSQYGIRYVSSIGTHALASNLPVVEDLRHRLGAMGVDECAG